MLDWPLGGYAFLLLSGHPWLVCAVTRGGGRGDSALGSECPVNCGRCDGSHQDSFVQDAAANVRKVRRLNPIVT